MSYLNCPHCAEEIEISPKTDWDQDDIYEQKCPKCEKIFCFATKITVSHEAWHAPCKNGGDHKWIKHIM